MGLTALLRSVGMRERWADLIGTYSGERLRAGRVVYTIATGAINIGSTNGSLAVVDTEAAAASDDLDTISGGVDGDLLVVQAASSSRTVVAKDGSGNLKLAGDCTLDNSEDTLTLMYSGTNWKELARSSNGT